MTIATLGLSIPLLARSLLDFARFIIKPFGKWVYSVQVYYNTVAFFFLDLVPICFQLSTLIFGYIRQRDNKKYRLEVQKANETGDETGVDSEFESKKTVSASKNSSGKAISYFDPPLLDDRNFNSSQRRKSVGNNSTQSSQYNLPTEERLSLLNDHKIT